MKSKRLGRGLEALIPQITPEDEETRGESLNQIPVSLIKSNPQQPRLAFDRKKLDELKQSISENGLIQPITVRKADDGFELISGERRLRAVQELDVDMIPAYIMEVESEEKLLELSLIENIQRDDLNAIEVAHAYERLQKEYKLTQEEVAQKVGKDRATVANFIRLLKLPDKIQDSLKKEEISMGHARAIMGIASRGEQVQIWKKTVNGGWSVRKVEDAVRQMTEKTEKEAAGLRIMKNPAMQSLEDQLRTLLGTQVKIHQTGDRGKIEISYFSREDLDRLVELLKKIGDS
ncbi:ParB/RepB/Spo0J family partition protein [bacterium]|nr:ParB/RepB/Spo0J family partition protein [bacterium]